MSIRRAAEDSYLRLSQPKPRTPEELDEIERDIRESQPLKPLSPEDLKRIGMDPLKGAQEHMHDIQFALTKAGRLVRLKGGEHDPGESTLWQNSEQYRIDYDRLPERNRAAYLLAKFLGLNNIMPVTVLRTVRQGDRYINGTAQEWIFGEMVYNVEKTGMQQYATAWVFEYLVYNRDRNVGSKMIRESDREIIAPDQDFTYKAPAAGDSQAFPPRNQATTRELNPPYGESLNPEFVDRMLNLTKAELDHFEWQLRNDCPGGLLDDEEIKALRNRIVLIANLLRMSRNSSIPRLADNSDYISESRFYNPGQNHVVEVGRKAQKDQLKKAAA